jgi:hypothetical protein
MKRYGIAVLLAALASLALAQGFCPALASGSQTQSPERAALPGERRILDAAVRITMVCPGPDPAQVIVASGLGTVASYPGGNLIFTHDHWGETLDNVTQVQFRDAANELLLEMEGDEFEASMLYRDHGTMVIRASEELRPNGMADAIHPPSRPAALPTAPGERGAMNPGDIVLVTVQRTGGMPGVEVIEAVVESVAERQERATVQLRTVGGRSLVPGDSGGGVWFKGHLMGNLWAAVVIQATSTASTVSAEIGTDMGVAAIYPWLHQGWGSTNPSSGAIGDGDQISAHDE